MDDVLLEMVGVCRGFIGGNGEAGETLTQIAALGATALDADMAGLTLSDTHAGPRTAVCTDRIVRGIEQSQYDADRGPCLDASRDGDCYRVAGTDDDWARWPEFLSAARSHGVNSSLSVPVIVAGRPIGALNFYSQHSAHFDDRMARTADAFATQTAIIAAYCDKADLAEHLQRAMENRATIEQAKGVVMATVRCTARSKCPHGGVRNDACTLDHAGAKHRGPGPAAARHSRRAPAGRARRPARTRRGRRSRHRRELTGSVGDSAHEREIAERGLNHALNVIPERDSKRSRTRAAASTARLRHRYPASTDTAASARIQVLDEGGEVTVTPVEARCNRCGGDFALAELLDRRDGCCPRCGWRLTDDWASVLLDEARRVDVAQKHLASSLRRLRELPGNPVLLPHPVVRNLVDALGWEQTRDEDGSLDDQRELLTELAGRWTRHPDAARTARRWSRRRAATPATNAGGVLAGP